MTRPTNDTERLEALLDVLEESILSATDEEIIEETRLEGRDPEAVAGKVRELITSQLRKATPAPPMGKLSWWHRIIDWLRPNRAIPQGLVPIISELARGLVTELAPHELPLFRTTWVAFVKDLKKWLKGPGRTAEMLAFGLDNNTVSLTPAVLVVTAEVVHFVTERVQESVPTARAEDVAERVKEMLIGPRSTEDGGKAPPPLTSEQFVQIRQLALERASRSGLPEEQARRLADALVERIPTIGA